MGKKNKIKKILPKEMKPNFLEVHWEKIIIVILFLLPLIYFAQFLSSGVMIAGSDYLSGYPFEKWTKEQREMPLWYSYVFGGVPVLGAPVGGPLAPLNVLKSIMPPHVALVLTFILFFFIAGLGMYLYLKEIGLSPFSAAFGAIAYQFIGNLATAPSAGHAGRAASIATFPLMLFFFHRALKSRGLLYFIAVSLTAAFAFYEGHFQITYYGLLFIIGYFIYYIIAHRKEYQKKDLIKIIGYGICAIALIFLLMSAVWLPVLGGLKTAARGVERGYEYAISWALPLAELFDLLVPSFSGILENYWGANPFKLHTEYFGLLPIIFAVFTIFLYRKKPYVKFYLIGLIAAILTALGGATPFFKLLYLLIPGFKLTRAPSLIFYLASFSFIVLGSIGFENFIIKKEINKKRFLTVAGISTGAFILLMLILTMGIGRQIAGTRASAYENNLPNFTQGIWLSLLLVVVILIFAYFTIQRKIKPLAFSVLAILIYLINQLPITTKYLSKAPAPEVYYATDDIVHFLYGDHSIYRVFPFQSQPPLNPRFLYHIQDSYLLYHNIQSAGGYIPNPIQRYQDFIGAGTSVMFAPANLFLYPSLTDILNLKYIVAPNLPEEVTGYDVNTQKIIQNLKDYLARFRLVFRGRQFSVYQNDSALPRAYIVPDYQVDDAPKILEVLKSPQFEPRQIVLLEEDPKVPHPTGKLPMIEAKITEYSPNKIVCTTDAFYPGFLVLTDNWHPDWKVFVDGKKNKMFIANYTFRATYLTVGKHEVAFAYISPYFSSGKVITILSLIVSIVLIFLSKKFGI